MAMRANEQGDRPLRTFIYRLSNAPWAIAVLWPVFLSIGGYLTWRYWGVDHVTPQFASFAQSQITITPPPAYVRSDVVGRVFEDTAMEKLSLLDPAATSKVASAFSMHPWVGHVQSVRKLAGGTVDIRVAYRRPVAMVRVFKSNYGANERYFLPIDNEAILLPSDEFAPSEVPNFIHIEMPGANSTARAGLPFDDPRVEAAAKLADLLRPHREALSIEKITTLSRDRFSTAVATLVIILADGTEVTWGSTPGGELPGEATAEVKLHRLTTQLQNSDIATRPPQRSQRGRPASIRLD